MRVIITLTLIHYYILRQSFLLHFRGADDSATRKHEAQEDGVKREMERELDPSSCVDGYRR